MSAGAGGGREAVEHRDRLSGEEPAGVGGELRPGMPQGAAAAPGRRRSGRGRACVPGLLGPGNAARMLSSRRASWGSLLARRFR